MKNVIASLILLVGLVSAETFHHPVSPGDRIKTVQGPGFAELMVDVTMDPLDTVYSAILDLWQVPVAKFDTGAGTTALVTDWDMGDVIVSCYDISDSAGVDDSVNVDVQMQKAQYAAENNRNVLLAKSDAWASLGSAIQLSDVSNTNTIVEGTAALTLASDLDRFVRARLIRTTAAAKDVTRCRVYAVRKPWAK